MRDDDLKKKIEDSIENNDYAIEQIATSYITETYPPLEKALAQAVSKSGKTDHDHFIKLLAIWLKLQENEIQEIGSALREVLGRIRDTNKKVKARIESPEYVSLVKNAFRNWGGQGTVERQLITNLLINAAILKLSPDYALEIFIDWIDKYSEEHFSVIEMISRSPGITRHDIFLALHPKIPQEDSAEADMFKLLMQDLTMGHIVRQEREKDYFGNFVKNAPVRRSRTTGPVINSAFDDQKQYVLTELGKQFVRYTQDTGIGLKNGESSSISSS